jgi:hypothetical protein
VVRGARGRCVSAVEVRGWCCEVPHQGVSLRDGSVARHLFAPRGCMVRSGHDPQGLNQLVDVATVVGVMPIPSALGVVSELHAAARWRQRISPSRRP